MWRLAVICAAVLCSLGISLLVIFLRDSSDFSLVRTEVGYIKGAKSSDGEYYEFLGIPYGILNSSNVFGASLPYPPFEDIFEATDNSAICPQYNGNYIGSLNCLQLNIYVPSSVTTDSNFPIMVSIHGGGFETGSKGSYGPKYLVRHNVILVTINYRLGPYGFMCLDIPEVAGNQGLKDQVLAFRWIRENMKAFRGDVDRITAFGVSAGAHSVDFHLLSDTEKLFNNAIIQSGSALSATVFTEPNHRAPLAIAEHLGFQTDSILDAITLLSSVNPNTVIEVSNTLRYSYRPCTEITFDNVEPFMSTPWINGSLPKVKDMDIIIGFAEDELLLFHFDTINFENSTVIRNRFLNTFNFDDERLQDMVALVHEFYLSDFETEDLLFPVVYMDSDFTYIYPIQRSIRKYIENEASNVYYYMFSYNGGRNLLKHRYNVTFGSAVHSDDVGYLFEVQELDDEINANDQLILDRFTKMWTDFAKYSDPTPETSDILPVRWVPTTSETKIYLRIDSTVGHGTDPAHERMAFWDEFYNLNEEYQKGLL